MITLVSAVNVRTCCIATLWQSIYIHLYGTRLPAQQLFSANQARPVIPQQVSFFFSINRVFRTVGDTKTAFDTLTPVNPEGLFFHPFYRVCRTVPLAFGTADTLRFFDPDFCPLFSRLYIF